MLGNKNVNNPTQDQGGSTVLIQPAQQPARSAPRSAVEEILSARAGTPLTQFGYREMGVGRAVLLPQAGGVQADYVLGPGDEIVVTLRGQEASEFRAVVDRNGRVFLPKLNPINVAGRTFLDFQQDLMAAVRRGYVATEAYVALGRVRQIRVSVGGEVNNPGIRVLTGLASAVDALSVSSGVKKTGSLRNVQIIRGGRRIRLDLYGILRGTSSGSAPLLADGDRIIVPALGPTVAIAGPVRIPGIFELAPGQTGMTVAALVNIAGGFTVRGRYNLSLVSLAADGSTQMSDLPNDRVLVRDSDVVIVRGSGEHTVGRALLQSGENSNNITYATQARQLSAMLRSPGVMGDDPYPLLAVISRRDPTTLIRSLLAVSPSEVLAGRQDFTLQSDDIVHTFTRAEAKDLIAAIQWFDQQRHRLNRQVGRQGDVPLLATPEALGLSNVNEATSRDNGTVRQSSALESSSLQRRAEYPGQTDAATDQDDDQDGDVSNNIARDLGRSRDLSQGPDGLAANGAGPVTSPAEGDYGFDNKEPFESGSNTAVTRRLGSERESRSGDLRSGVTARLAAGGIQAQKSLEIDRVNRYRRELGRVERLANAVKVEPAIVANFLFDRFVTLDGAIRGPGKYFVGPDLTLGTLIQAAGGVVNWSDRTAIERVSTVVSAATGEARTATQTLDLTKAQFATMIAQPGDFYRFPHAAVQTVGSMTLRGEVRHPGLYTIKRGERLSDVLVRAGGLNSVAYPYGAVFLRKSAAAREREGYRQAARDLERQLTVSMTRTPLTATQGVGAVNYESLRALVNDLRNQEALGRVAVVADPTVLTTHPEIDPLVEDGDVLFMPQRPSTVTVLGEVMNNTNIPVQPGMTIAGYIGKAGGYARFADDSRTFLVLPDGTARPVEKSWFGIGDQPIPPGSTIVVPKDVDPFDVRAVLVTGTQVLSQLAISAASLAILTQRSN